MALRFLSYLQLPAHGQRGGFDHAAVHRGLNRLYVAHTANDAVDVVDCEADRYLYSIPHLIGVAGALVSEEDNLVFTSNRGENTIGIFMAEDEKQVDKIQVGMRPNGLAYDAGNGLLLVAHVGDKTIQGSETLMLVDVRGRCVQATITVPGRTRWAVFDQNLEAFYVNIADPSLIVVVESGQPDRIARSLPIPAAGPHGLDIDPVKQRLFCACDAGKLIVLDIGSGEVEQAVDLSGAPDVIFFNGGLEQLYVAIGEPGVMDVVDTRAMERIETIPTEKGAHTLAFDGRQNKVYAFLPQSERAAVYAG